MRNIIFFLKASIIFSLLVFTSCKKDEPKIPEVKIKRTVLVYMAGENSLSRYAPINLDSIVSGMSKVNNPVNFLVFEDRKNMVPNLWKIEKDSKKQTVKTLVKTYEELNSVNTENMKNIINEVFTKYPADEKCLILWSHGTGWLPSSNFVPQNAKVERSFGQDNNNYMEIWDLRKALEQTSYFDLIIFDACFMSSAEALYELKDVARNIIASPTEIFGNGFPYHTLVPQLCKETINPQEICAGYMNYYNEDNYGGTISLIDCNYLDELAGVYKKILASADYSNITTATIQEYGRKENFFTNRFYDIENVVEVINPTFLTEFKSVMGKVVPYYRFTPFFYDLKINRCSGMSVFIPELNHNGKYYDAYPVTRWYDAVN